LHSVVADLPTDWLRERSRLQALDRARSVARAGLDAHLTSYALVMLLLVGIWLSVGVTAGAWYPWPIWPALGWGIGIVGHVRAARAGGTGR
ncbi:MAG: 2TM domain-containing protein, partial [Actinomycetota bacterium]|nr:2TM domain-containing protein [Actinomycetota bacterium]